MGGLRGPGRRTVVAPVALLALLLAAGSIGSVGPVSQAAEPDSPAVAPSPAAEPPPSPVAGPIDEADARARVVRLGAAALGLPVDQVDLFALEWRVIPGDPSRWAGGKVLRIGGTEVVVAWANLDTGEVIDGATFETRSRASGVNEGDRGDFLRDFGAWVASATFSPPCFVMPAPTTVPVSMGGGRRVRFAITAQSHGVYSEGANGFGTDDTYSDGRLSDIDLSVFDKDGTQVDVSTSPDWSTEWVEWTYDATRGPYSVRISPYSWSCSLAQEKIGWAWVAWSAP